MRNLRNLTEGEGKGKNSYKQRGREANHKRLLNTGNKLRVDRGLAERGKWVMDTEEGPFGVSTQCCM